MMRSLFYDYVRHGAVLAASATTESWFRIEAANYGYGSGALYNYGTGAPPATANQFAPGAIYQRVDASPALYVNTGTLASPTWTTVAASSTTMALTYAATTASSQITATTNGNSASLVMNVLSAVYTQTTTARTSGSANGVLVTITGLAGDGASATFNGINLAAPTANGGSAVYTGIAFGTGWTYLVDTSACATGTAKWRMKTNVASAYVLQDSAATPVVFMTAITTTATPSLAVTVPLTTTNGITSGTARLVGGIAYNLAAAGSTLTASSTETQMAAYTIPANTLLLGTMVRITWQLIQTAKNGTDTLTVSLRCGPTTLTGTKLVTGTATAGVVNGLNVGEFNLVCRASPSAASACVGVGGYSEVAAAGGPWITEYIGATNFATNGALVVELTAQFSCTSASNSCRCDIFTVELF